MLNPSPGVVQKHRSEETSKVHTSGNGDETDDFNSAVVGIVRVGDDEWFTVVFDDYETARVH